MNKTADANEPRNKGAERLAEELLRVATGRIDLTIGDSAPTDALPMEIRQQAAAVAIHLLMGRASQVVW